MIEESNTGTAFYPNKIGRVFLLTLQDVLLQDGYSDLLELAGCPHFAQKLPPDNWAREFDFSTVSRLNQGLEQLYGPRGGRRLALSAGTKFFESGWGELGSLAEISNIALKARSLPDKLQSGLQSMARHFTEVSDQVTWIEEQERQIEYHVASCPVCWKRAVDNPVCFHTIGFLQGALYWFSSGLDFRVRQTSCKAMGEEHCIFRIDTEPLK